jgi:predicted nuclease of restriction endonuclease-like RecB superfamily
VVSARAALARCSARDGVVTPHWLGARDLPRVIELLEVYRAFVGERRGDLEERVESLVRVPGSSLACAVLDTLFRTRVVARVAPSRVRAEVFADAASLASSERARAFDLAAARLGVTAQDIKEALFADLARERRVEAPARAVTSEDVVLRCNLALAEAALACSSSVRIVLEGHARAIVRHARLRGLICTASPCGSVEISGPLALFRRTALYGRQLAELLPILAWSRGFRLEAECVVKGREGKLVLDPSAPLLPAAEPRRYDSKLEERFVRDFLRLAPEWNAIREPRPVPAEGTLIFPDFALVHRRFPARRWLVEILGFWTASYVETKLRRLRAAGLSNLILCIDAARDCGAHALPADARVLRFEKRVDAAKVLDLLEHPVRG